MKDDSSEYNMIQTFLFT